MKINFRPGQILTNLWRRYSAPAFLCLLACVSWCIWEFIPYANDTEQPFRDLLEKIAWASMTGLVLSTAVCTLRTRLRFTTALSWAAAAAGIALYLLVDDAELIGGIVLASLALCFFGVSEKKAPAIRLNQVFGWFFISLGLSVVIFIALTVISSAVVSLFFGDLNYHISSAISTDIVYVSYMLFAPWMFLGGLPDENTPVDKRLGFSRFNARILLPLSFLLMAVLLAYVAKIVLTWTMPVGTMNGYALIALALFTFFHLTLTGEENPVARFFKRWGAWLMLPVLAAQQVGVWIRVEAYGLTASRILGIVMTVLCAAVVVTALLRKRANWFFPAAALAALIFIASPFNAANIAMDDQVSRLETALMRNNMLAEDGSIVANPDADKEDQAIIWSAMDYVLNNYSPDEPLAVQMHKQLCEIREDEFDPEEPHPWVFYANTHKRELLGFFEPGYENTAAYLTFSGTAESWKLDTADYDYAQWISIYEYATDEDDKPWEPDITSDEICICSFDFPAVIDALNSSDEPEFVLPDAALTFLIDGEQVDLRPLLAALEETTDPVTPHNRTFTIVEDRLPLPSGKVLHVGQFSLDRHSYSTYTSYSLSLSGWLLTPEAD